MTKISGSLLSEAQSSRNMKRLKEIASHMVSSNLFASVKRDKGGHLIVRFPETQIKWEREGHGVTFTRVNNRVGHSRSWEMRLSLKTELNSHSRVPTRKKGQCNDY